jgi:hypothetical protein
VISDLGMGLASGARVDAVSAGGGVVRLPFSAGGPFFSIGSAGRFSAGPALVALGTGLLAGV